MPGIILLCAGGTGGHLFPAEALATALTARGWSIHLATDHRVDSYAGTFPAETIHVVPSATFTRSPVAAFRAGVQLARGMLAARRLVRRVKPAAAVGFGGYPTLPPMLAATRAGVPTVIHDANAVLGRANRFLVPRVTAVATSFARVAGAEAATPKTVETGNPVRASVIAAAGLSYPARTAEQPFVLLVFGGSQGARFMSDLVPPAVALMAAPLRETLTIVQQCRPEDMERTAAAYRELGVAADLQPFFRDLPARISRSHLVISRSGASTVAELAVIGRPAIMVPLPHAIDQDQKANAEVLQRAGGGWMIEQRDLTPERLARELAGLVADPARLMAAATAARAVGRPDAVDRLADLVERVARREPVAAKEAKPS